MLNSTLHEAGKGFGDNHFVQKQDDYKNYLTEPGQPLSDTSADEKSGKVIPVQLEKPDENLYFCHYLTGGAELPGVIVETAGLANIKPPRPTYRPRLPIDLITSGKISQIQLERIIYAGQAHAQRLPFSIARAGISIGDGTGVGKTGTILGIILNNWFSGRKKTIWFSVKFDLIKAVKDQVPGTARALEALCESGALPADLRAEAERRSKPRAELLRN